MKAGRIAACAVLALAAGMAAAVESEPSERIAADPDVAAGRQAQERGDWKEAAARLQRAERRFPRDADLQNALGYTFRQLKDYDAAFRHYGNALRIDPRHRGAHEYIGETYLLVGDVASAEKHLASLRSICMLACDEVRDLQKAIADHKAKAATPPSRPSP